MLLQRLHPPICVAIDFHGPLRNPVKCLNEKQSQVLIRITWPGQTWVRHASHNQQSSHHQKKDGPGKRLGAKKSGEEYVIPGNIIFRQRGTHWFPGENAGMGRDHTIFSKIHGYVKYYKDPRKHPKRQYIGVALERHHVLPYNPQAARPRRLNMVVEKMERDEFAKLITPPKPVVPSAQIVVATERPKERRGEEGRNLRLRPGYMYRESNWEIGRAAERAKVKVPKFKPGDRWTAWRKTVARKLKNAEKRVGRAKKVKGKAKPKGKAKAKL